MGTFVSWPTCCSSAPATSVGSPSAALLLRDPLGDKEGAEVTVHSELLWTGHNVSLRTSKPA